MRRLRAFATLARVAAPLAVRLNSGVRHRINAGFRSSTIPNAKVRQIRAMDLRGRDDHCISDTRYVRSSVRSGHWYRNRVGWNQRLDLSTSTIEARQQDRHRLSCRNHLGLGIFMVGWARCLTIRSSRRRFVATAYAPALR